MTQARTASLTIGELREFASFTSAEQRYIRRGLDIGLGRQDAFRLWARTDAEKASIRGQYLAYEQLKPLRTMRDGDLSMSDMETFMGKLVHLATYDLMQERISSFSAFRFLYERLLGAWVRPWLPSAFCGAAALPQIDPERRKTLLHSLSEAAATAPAWSDREPSFYPEYITREAA